MDGFIKDGKVRARKKEEKNQTFEKVEIYQKHT